MQFHPTINEEREIGGSRNFGAKSFTPDLTGVTGTYISRGIYQGVGKILFWSFELTGNSFTTTSAVFTPPIPPQKVSAAAVFEAGQMAHGGMFFDENSMHIMNTDGTCSLDNATTTDGVRRFSGWYWTK
jgi:hypothetical protein